MKILAGNRRSGKTSELIRISHDKWQYIICKDRQRVDNIVRLADKMNLDIPYPITVRELPLRSKYIGSVLVDDIEDVLSVIIGKNINIATTSCNIRKINMELLNKCIRRVKRFISNLI